jgi:hypothetical protein
VAIQEMFEFFNISRAWLMFAEFDQGHPRGGFSDSRTKFSLGDEKMPALLTQPQAVG